MVLPSLPPSVTILGAGLTSLSLAHRLTTLSPLTKVTIVEANDRVGGWMKTKKMKQEGGDHLDVAIEEGPRSVRPKGGIGAARLLGLVQDLNLTSSLCTIPLTHPSASNRFLLYPSTTLLKLPSSLLSLFYPPTPITLPLITSVLKEPFVPRLPPSTSDESVDSFVRRRFGPFIADSLLSAMVHGIYAADSRNLSVRSAFPYLWEAEKRRGSVVAALFRGLGKEKAEEKEKREKEEQAWKDLGEYGERMRKGVSVWGLKGGLGTLTERLKTVLKEERGVNFLMGESVKGIKLLKGDEGVEITTSKTTFTTPLVISTISSTALDTFLPANHSLPFLSANPSATVSLVTLVFPNVAPGSSQPPYYPPGFGYLVPRANISNPKGILGVVFDSSAMGSVDSPAISDKIVKFTIMMGGPHYNPPSPLRPPQDPETLVPIALEHLRATLPNLPKDLEPMLTFAGTHFDCIPTYLPGHGERMRELGERLAEGEWKGKLVVAGASYGGVSVNDCVDSGMALAEKLVEGGKVATGLEKFASWEPHHPRAPKISTPSAPPRLTRSYSRLSSTSSQPRFSVRSPFATRHVLRSSFLARHSSTTAHPPHAAKPLPPWNTPTADMQPREVPWIFSLIWKGLKVYALLFFIWAGFVVWGNKEYIISEFARASKDTAPHEYRAPAGTKEVKLEDVKGVEEAKEELREFVEFLKDPMRFANLGGRPNKGILLAGPPGTGKTMLARAVANEAGVPFFYASGSEFEDKYVGVGAQKVKKLFATAKAHSPSIIFIDELDTIGGSREQSMEGDIQAGGSRGKQTLNMLLTEMDGFSSSDDVVVMAATNFPESLDAALTRPGRFDRHIDVPLPDVQGRLAILNEYMKGVKAADGLDLSLIARGTPGMSGADLENIVNQAAVRASKEGDWAVRLKHLDWSKDRSLMGVERKSRLVSEESLNTSAYIEGGHALVALLTPHSVPLHKVSILPRGTKLSVTSQVPGMDQDSISKVEYLARLDVALAGRVAEELVYGADHVSDRTYQDLSRASRAADAMVRKLGYSDLIGLVNLDDSSMPWLSKTKKSQIESETKRLVTEASERARHVLEENRTSLDNLAKALREHETLSAAQVKQVLAGEKVVKVVPEATPPRPPPPPPPPPAPEEAASAAQPVEGSPTKEGQDRDKGMLVI